MPRGLLRVFANLGWTVYVVAIVTWLLFPLSLILLSSFQGTISITTDVSNLNVSAYEAIPDRYWNSLWFTVQISVVATVTALLVSVPAAWAMVRGKLAERRFLSNVVLLPDVVPHIILGIALLTLYLQIGLARTWLGMLLAMLSLSLAMGLRFTEALLEGLPEEYELAAETMGANKLQALVLILMPLMAPGLATAALFIFISNMVTFELLFFISGPNASPIAVRLFSDIIDRGIMPHSVAMASIMIYISIAFYVIVALTLGPKYLAGSTVSRKG
ncbi:ABC transporter permease subunit [Arsenicitalea aurantiaca]|uniref:ABC transporter permease subunit n=1 Tax=Arsenicitalea aurantiaca TaxID=1783274 RepID=A0A433X2I2_9HYPH|nr:ABC transporter permease subunit [Arsenicitalea aurantiaca]RUT28288.1 ABC transporter permease subunit [Arsenicitalea aurantiaca]